MHLRGRLVEEALTVEGVEHGLTLPGIQRTWRRRPRSPWSRWLPPSIHRAMPKASHAAAVPIVARAVSTAVINRAEAIIAFQKKVAELLGIPLKPLPSDEDDAGGARAAGWPFRGRPSHGPTSSVADRRRSASALVSSASIRARAVGARSPDATSKALRVATGPRARRGAYTRRLSAGPRACRRW